MENFAMYEDFYSSEKIQSHTFIKFYDGPPYTQLGWRKYRKLISMLNDYILKIKEEENVDVFLQEYEVKLIDRFFLWTFSFLEEDIAHQQYLTSILRHEINMIMSIFYDNNEQDFTSNNHDDDFELDPSSGWADFYCHLVSTANHELEHIHPPKYKSYKKENIDIKPFSNTITIEEFCTLIDDYLYGDDTADKYEYLSAFDGFFSSKYRESKYLREEFIPIKNFIAEIKIPSNSSLDLGLKTENYDAMVTLPSGESFLLEITCALPSDDHKLLSILSQSHDGFYPLKNMAKLKIAIDDFPLKIIEVINAKYNKNYEEERTLIVYLPSEYTYQNENYILKEVFNEVANNIPEHNGSFTQILLLANRTFHRIK